MRTLTFCNTRSPTHLRMIIYMSSFCFTADSSLLGLQVQRPPMNWKPATLSSFNDAKSFMSLLGTLIITRLYLRFTSTSTAVAELNLMLVAETFNLLSVVALVVSPFVLGFGNVTFTLLNDIETLSYLHILIAQ